MAVDFHLAYSLFFFFFCFCSIRVSFSFPLDVVHTLHTTFFFPDFPFVLALKVSLLLRPIGIPVAKCHGIPTLPLLVLPPGCG